jgi:CheY-like chemotaxis protein
MSDSLTGIRVLVVEDHDDSRDVLDQTLRFQGATVKVAATAADALESVDLADVVVTDFAMPERDGAWLLAQVARLPRPIPVILLSGFSAVQIEAIAQAPFARKLLKPVDPWQLSAEILDVLAAVMKASGDRGGSV